MHKTTAVFLVIFLLVLCVVVVAAVILSRRAGDDADKIEILDGDGTVVEKMTGTVTAVTEEKTGLLLTIALDEESACRFGEDTVCVIAEAGNPSHGQNFASGDRVSFTFISGTEWTGSPKVIEPCDCFLEDKEEEAGTQ